MHLSPSTPRRLRPLILPLLAALLFTAGCATRGYQRAENTADSVTEAANEIDLARSQIAEATTALDVLINRNPTDLRASFERYRSAVASLDTTYADVLQNAEDMAANGEKYFAEWDKRLAQMQNEDIRSRSLERQQEVTARFTDIQDSYRRAREQFPALLANLHDIQRLLGVDLTPAGIESARQFAGRVEDDAARLRRTLDELADRFRRLSSTLTPGSA